MNYKQTAKPTISKKKIIRDGEDVFKHLQKFLKDFDKNREYFILLGVNARQELIYCNIEAIGGRDIITVDPAVIFKTLLVNNCKAFIIAHNHPSNNSSPSAEDKNLTERFKEIGKLLGIQLLDHLVFASNFKGYESVIFN